MPLASVFGYALGTPVVWIWGVILADHLVRAAWLTGSFRRGRWRGAADGRGGPPLSRSTG